MDLRSFAVIVMILCSGCQQIGRQEPVNYRTVQASPHRNSEWAQDETNRAEELLLKGELDKAEQALHLALVADVSYGPAHNNLGQLYFSQGDYYLAAWEFEYAIRLMPERPEPLNNLGLVYEQTGKLDDAIGFYESAHELRPEDSQYLGNLVRCRLRRGDQDAETRHLLAELVALETRPDWLDWAQEQLVFFDRPSGQLPLTAPAKEILPPPLQSP